MLELHANPVFFSCCQNIPDLHKSLIIKQDLHSDLQMCALCFSACSWSQKPGWMNFLKNNLFSGSAGWSRGFRWVNSSDGRNHNKAFTLTGMLSQITDFYIHQNCIGGRVTSSRTTWKTQILTYQGHKCAAIPKQQAQRGSKLHQLTLIMHYVLFVSHQFYYPGANVVQMRFLRLHSSTAIQKMTYVCHPGHVLGQTDRDVKFLTDSRKQSYLGALKDCVVCKKFSKLPLSWVCLRKDLASWKKKEKGTIYTVTIKT